MGNTINLKAADGFTLSAYTAGPPARPRGSWSSRRSSASITTCATWPTGSRPRVTLCARRQCSTAPRSGVELGYTQEDIDEGRG